jgi:hypothetical protein
VVWRDLHADAPRHSLPAKAGVATSAPVVFALIIRGAVALEATYRVPAIRIWIARRVFSALIDVGAATGETSLVPIAAFAGVATEMIRACSPARTRIEESTTFVDVFALRALEVIALRACTANKRALRVGAAAQRIAVMLTADALVDVGAATVVIRETDSTPRDGRRVDRTI